MGNASLSIIDNQTNTTTMRELAVFTVIYILFIASILWAGTFVSINSNLNSGVYQGQYTEIMEGLEVLQGADRDRIVNRAIEWNADVRNLQYWANVPVISLAYPDRVMELQTIPIR